MYCAAGAPNDVCYKNNTYVAGISIHYFPKDVAVWPKWTRFDLRSPKRDSWGKEIERGRPCKTVYAKLKDQRRTQPYTLLFRFRI